MKLVQLFKKGAWSWCNIFDISSFTTQWHADLDSAINIVPFVINTNLLLFQA